MNERRLRQTIVLDCSLFSNRYYSLTSAVSKNHHEPRHTQVLTPQSIWAIQALNTWHGSIDACEECCRHILTLLKIDIDGSEKTSIFANAEQGQISKTFISSITLAIVCLIFTYVSTQYVCSSIRLDSFREQKQKCYLVFSTYSGGLIILFI